MRSNTVLTSMLLPLLILAACARKPDDKQLAQKIQAQLQNDKAINGQIGVSSANGMVTLTGQVPNDAARALAEREAHDTAGVKQVVNELQVMPSSAEAPPAEVNTPPPPADANAAPQTAAPPSPVIETIPAGAVISVRLIDSLDSARNRPGDIFRGTLHAPIRVAGQIAVPAGAGVEGRVVEDTQAGHFKGRSELGIALTKLVFNHRAYALRTRDVVRSTGARGKGSAETVGGGGAFGAIIGAIAGGGKGAAIGALAGGGAGAVVRREEKRPHVIYPSETVLSFQLRAPVHVEEAAQ
jgi:BON domain